MSTGSFNVLAPKITLSPVESKITALLKDYTSYYNSTHNPQTPLELRITGGWVRDKLLGKQSHDLDIAINILSGQTFAEQLHDYLRSHPEYGVETGGIHTIEKNPEKSKHLETATTKLYGLDIDFVNLRSEEYTEDSRIPVVQFGTPEQDALRRDATLNALFYNVQHDEVEDLTQRGLVDLRDGVLRTPLDPQKTFLDDPLRVLRLIRFASRFGFTLDDETYAAMKDHKVKQALLDKISRERVGVEVAKILESDAPRGLELLCGADLVKYVFNFGSLSKDVAIMNDSELLNKFESVINEETLFRILKINELNKNLGVNVLPDVLSDLTLKRLFWAGVVVQTWDSTKIIFNKKGKVTYAVDAILREGVKFSKNDADIITKIITSLEEFEALVLGLQGFKRSQIGTLLRQYGDKYEFALVYNFWNSALTSNDTQTLVDQYQRFNQFVKDEKLDEAYRLKPLIDGKSLCKRFERKPGPWMSGIMDKILLWQLDNPDKSVEECFHYVEGIL